MTQTTEKLRTRFNGPSPPTIANNREDLDRQRHSRSSSAELTPEPLVFVPQRQRNAVSRREDETDNWGIDELDSKEEHRLLLRDNSLRSTVLSRLNTFRRNRELCDVILFVKEREITGHKVVLAAVSNSLFELFKNENESPAEELNVDKKENSRSSVGPNNSISYFEFNQGDYECFDALVDFAYTGVLSISSLKISDLYKTSFALQVHQVAAACARHLAENLSVSNCIGVRRHANFNNDIFLVDKVDSFIVENLEKVINDSVEFTKLPCVKTRVIIPHNGHEISEDLATNMAERTIAYFQTYPKISDRVEQQIEALTQKSHLLFAETDKDTLEDCSNINNETTLGACEVIQDYKRSKESKSAKTAGHNSQPLGVPPVQHHVTGALPIKLDASRIANAKYASNESLDSIGSSQTDVEQEIESKLIACCCCDKQTVRSDNNQLDEDSDFDATLTFGKKTAGFWIALSVLYKRLVVLSIQLTDDEDLTGSAESTATTPPHETLNGNSHLISGANAKQPTDLSQASVLAKIANCSALSRHPIPPMSVARCSIGIGFLNGKIIVAGGYNRGECLKSVEEYDLETGKWKGLTPMRSERGRLGGAVVNNKFYAVGGSDGNTDLQTAECYDPKTQTWTSMPPLNGRPRSNNCCTELNGYLYCIGGSSDQQALRDCERFNFESGKWETIAPLQASRSQAACTTFRGQVIVVGGCNRSGCLETVEAYDPQTNTWKLLAKLGAPRRGAAVVACKNSIYVIGGNDGTQPLTTCEALEHPNSHWRAAPSLNTSRANTSAIASAGNVIYLIGGFDNVQFLATVEAMETETLGWRNWIQKTLARNKSLNEDDEETSSLKSEEETKSVDTRSESVTPRASAATIAVQ